MSFFTAVNCMDGRVQLPVISYLKGKFGVLYVDVVSEPGPIRFLAEAPESQEVKSIFRRIDISVGKHQSPGIAVIGHHDCAGNPVPEARQREQLEAALDRLAARYPSCQLLGLWVDGSWKVHEVSVREPAER